MSENSSTLYKTVWRWRKGQVRCPIHGRRLEEFLPTRELFLPVLNEEEAQKVLNELKQKGILANIKRTHSLYDIVPKGTLIVFASSSAEVDLQNEKQNLENLKKYILSCGGIIVEEKTKVPLLKRLSLSLWKGRK